MTEPMKSVSLEDLVDEHQVYFRVYPAKVAQGSELVAVGYDIELYGTYGHTAHPPYAGCDECVHVYRDLHRIAAAAIVGGEARTMRSIDPYEPTVSFSASRPRQDVSCRIRVTHRVDYDHPIDECERSCLHEITTRLRALGVRGGSA